MVQTNWLGLSLLVGLFVVFFLGQWVMSSPTNNSSSGQGTIPSPNAPPSSGPAQEVYLKATNTGLYDPPVLKVKQNIPVNLHFSADSGAGCGHTLVIPSFNVWVVAPSSGEKVIRFTPTKKGTFDFHCSMNMFRGKMEVVP